MKRRRLEWLAENGPCVDCGSWTDLEVDHDDPEQKWKHAIWSYSKEKRDAELAKCKPRCRSCHKKKTVRENDERKVWERNTNNHGKAPQLEAGCACAICATARRSLPGQKAA